MLLPAGHAWNGRFRHRSPALFLRNYTLYKTMEMVPSARSKKRELAQEKDIVIIDSFDPWNYESEMEYPVELML